MRTTLNEIRKYSPCESGWQKLLKHLNKTKADDDELSFKTILAAVGIHDAIWCLCTQKYLDICLFCADIAEMSLHIFETQHPEDNRPRKAIKAIREWHKGNISEDQLIAAADNAYAAAAKAAYAADDAYATAATAAADAADAAADAADDAYATADATAYAVVYAAYASAAKAAARQLQLRKIEKLFIQYFCEDK